MSDPNPTPTDIFRARRGDRDALDRLLVKHHERFVHAARARLGWGLRARLHTSDLLQSTLLDVVHSVADFRGETDDAFVHWVGRIMDHNIRDKARYFKAGKREAKVVARGASNAVDHAPTPSAWAEFGDEGERLRNAMADLAPDYRRIIELRFVEGKSHREAAEVMGRTEEAMRILFWRARAALAVALEKRKRDETVHKPD